MGSMADLLFRANVKEGLFSVLKGLWLGLIGRKTPGNGLKKPWPNQKAWLGYL